MKNKVPLLILALAVVVYAIARPADANPYDSFTLAMDRFYGQGQWSAQSHEGSADNLTVKGLTLKVARKGQPEAPPLSITVDSVFVKKLPSKSQMEKLVALADWQNQPGADLAELLTIKGLRQAGTLSEGEFELALEEINLEGLKLAQAASGSPAGPAGFLRALRMAAAGYKNLRLVLKSQEPEAEAVVTAESGLVEGLSFGGDIPPELAQLLDAKLDPDGLYKELFGQSFKKFKIAGLKLDFQGRAPEAKFQARLSLAGLEETDVQALKTVGTLQLNDFQMLLNDVEGRVSHLNQAGFSLRGLDVSEYMPKLLAGLAASLAEAEKDPEKAGEIMAGQFSLADIFISPIALEEVVLTGLDLDFAGLISVKLAEMKAIGPYRSGEIPATAKSWMKGLEIKLSGNPQAEEGTPDRDIYEFSQKMGRTDFALEAETESAYEVGTGIWTSKLNLATRDLFTLFTSFTWGGLTPDRLEKFKTVPLSELQQAAMNPAELLGEASFNAFNIKLTNQGLVDLVFNLAAQSQGGVTGQEMKDGVVAQAGLMLPILGAQYVKNGEKLSQPLILFLTTPESLEIDLKATPPLTFQAFMEQGGGSESPLGLLDALNITLSANGQAGSPLRFAAGEGQE